MRIEWDHAKNEINQAKHGIDFETAQLIFDDPHCVTFVERVTDGEERWHAIGSIESIIVLVVVHTYREEDSEEVVRIIISPLSDQSRKETICPNYRLKSESNSRNSLPDPIAKST